MTDRRDFLAAAAALPLLPGALGRLSQPRPLRLLILGGTGLTGPHQVRYALDRGHKVTVFNRGSRSNQVPKDVEQLKGDRTTGNLDVLKGRDWDAVIDNPVSLPYWVRDAGAILKGHTQQYVFISTISVYDSAGQTAISETSPLAKYQGGDPLAVKEQQFMKDVGGLYGAMKAASEQEAAKWFGDATTILRPGLIVGPGDSTFRGIYWPYRIDKGGEILAPGDGNDQVQVIDVRDLAEWTIRVAESRALGTYNVVGPRSPMTMAEQLHGIRAALPGNSELRFTWVPAPFLAEHQVTPWGEMPTWIPASEQDHVIAKTSNTKAVAAGLTFRSLAATAADGLAWFKGLPATARAQVAKNAGLGEAKEKAVLAAWHQRKKGP